MLDRKLCRTAPSTALRDFGAFEILWKWDVILSGITTFSGRGFLTMVIVQLTTISLSTGASTSASCCPTAIACPSLWIVLSKRLIYITRPTRGTNVSTCFLQCYLRNSKLLGSLDNARVKTHRNIRHLRMIRANSLYH